MTRNSMVFSQAPAGVKPNTNSVWAAGLEFTPTRYAEWPRAATARGKILLGMIRNSMLFSQAAAGAKPNANSVWAVGLEVPCSYK